MKESEKAKDDRYILNPDTGRYVLKSGDIGKKIMKAIEPITPKEMAEKVYVADEPQVKNTDKIIAQLYPENVPNQSFADKGVEEAVAEYKKIEVEKIKMAQADFTKKLKEQSEKPYFEQDPVPVPRELEVPDPEGHDVQREELEEGTLITGERVDDTSRINIERDVKVEEGSEITQDSDNPMRLKEEMENMIKSFGTILESADETLSDPKTSEEQKEIVRERLSETADEIWRVYFAYLYPTYGKLESQKRFFNLVNQVFKDDIIKQKVKKYMVSNATAANFDSLARMALQQNISLGPADYLKIDENTTREEMESIINDSQGDYDVDSDVFSAFDSEYNFMEYSPSEFDEELLRENIPMESAEKPQDLDASVISPSVEEVHPVKYYPIQIKLLFGSNVDVPWDTELEKNVFDTDMSNAEIVSLMDGYITEFKNKIGVFKRQSETKEELHEIIQMCYCVMRNLQRGTRTKMAMVPVSSLVNLYNKTNVPATPPIPSVNSEEVQVKDDDNLESISVVEEKLDVLNPEIQAAEERIELGGFRFNIASNRAQDRLAKAYMYKRTDNFGKPIIEEVNAKFRPTNYDGPSNMVNPTGFYKPIEFKYKE